jgi:hypothetical protein
MNRVSFLASIFALCLTANAATVFVNFETVPPEPTGPSLFGGPEQTIIVPGVATFSGGTILGDASNFPAQSFATPPNIYATAGFGGAYQSTLTITIDGSFVANEISFPLFNGATQTESYMVDAFSGATMVGTQTFSNLPANTSSGFGIVDIKAPGITSVTIAPTTLNASCCSGWDYAIDSVAFNETVQEAFSPEPGTLTLLGLGLGFSALLRLRRKRY